MNPYCIKLDIAINITTLTIIDITVVLYFFLLLFKFLYAISPPVLNIFVMIFGHFIFLAFSFTSSELLIASIGVIFDAFLADFLQVLSTPNAQTRFFRVSFSALHKWFVH